MDNELNDYQRPASKVGKRLGSPANQPINPVPHQTHIHPRLVTVVGVFSLHVCFFSPCSSSSPLLCLYFRCPVPSPRETENSQSHNYRTELSISSSINPLGRQGTRERKGRAEKGDEKFKFRMKEAPLPLYPPSPGCSHVFGLRRERITAPQDELDPAIGGQTSYYSTGPPILITSK